MRVIDKNTDADTGINQDIIELSKYMHDNMVLNKLTKAKYNIKKLSSQFPFLETWTYNDINIWIIPKCINKANYVRFSNSACVFLKEYNESTLNHELMHIMDSLKDRTILSRAYPNKKVLTQLENIFSKYAYQIDLLIGLFYIADDREVFSFIQSYMKSSEDKKKELFSYFFLLRYFNLNKIIGDKNTLNQFVTIWKRYYGGSIPFLKRFSFQISTRNNTIVINEEESSEFIEKINTMLTSTGAEYIA